MQRKQKRTKECVDFVIGHPSYQIVLSMLRCRQFNGAGLDGIWQFKCTISSVFQDSLAGQEASRRCCLVSGEKNGVKKLHQ